MDILDQLAIYRCRLCIRSALLEIEFQGQPFCRSVETGGLGWLSLIHRFNHKLPDSNHMGTCSSLTVVNGADDTREEYPIHGTHGGPLCHS